MLVHGILAAAVLASPASNPAMEAWAERCERWDDWSRPAEPFRVYGNTYHVGTCGIAVFLVAGEEGHIVIDGGSNDGGPMVAANIEALGFRVEDIEILLHTHEHFDHVGGLSDLQQRSGAKVIASPLAAPVLATGEDAKDDPQFGMHEPFAPVDVSGTVADGETVRLGSLALTAIATPGHTPGALSWRWRSCENDACRDLVLMDSLSAVSADSYLFSEHPDYVARYRAGLAKLAALPCDIALTPHPSSSDMLRRVQATGSLEDPEGCRVFVAKTSASLDARLAKEAEAR